MFFPVYDGLNVPNICVIPSVIGVNSLLVTLSIKNLKKYVKDAFGKLVGVAGGAGGNKGNGGKGGGEGGGGDGGGLGGSEGGGG